MIKAKNARLIVEDYLHNLGFSHEKQKILDEVDNVQWLFRCDQHSIFIMIFKEERSDYIWIEAAISKENTFDYDLLLFMLKIQYSYLHPYRLAISTNGFIAIQFICPLSKVSNSDLKKMLENLIEFSSLISNEINLKFRLNSISFGESTGTSKNEEK
jgi:hypothetical protein